MILRHLRCHIDCISNSFSKNRRDFTILRRNIFSSPQSGKKVKQIKIPDVPIHGRIRIPAGGYFLLVIPVSTFCLGVWQVYRWKWKLQLIEAMETKVRNEITNFPYFNLEELNNLEYQKVKVVGEFNYTNEILLGPRSLLTSGESKPKGLISQGSQSGYHLITPFKIKDHNITILVNRGWIPTRRPKNYNSATGEVEIIGVVRRTENRAPFMGKNIPQQGLWLSRDISTMAQRLRTDEIFLDLHAINGTSKSHLPENPTPIPGQTRVTLRNEHVSYFCTWFSLSTITAYMWHRRFLLLKPLL